MATASEISADIAAVRTARTKLATGERVTEVWRDGRRLTFGTVTLESLDTLLNRLTNELAAATAEEAGSPRRRPISLRWKN